MQLPDSWNEYRISHRDYSVALTEHGLGLYNFEYVTRSPSGGRLATWQDAKRELPSAQRKKLWADILESTEELIRFSQKPNVLRRVPPDMVGHQRDREITDLLLRLGYTETRSWQDEKYFHRVYVRTDDNGTS